MRVLATKWFVRFARGEGLGDGELCEAIERAEAGSIDADLGGHLVKQRVARTGGGRSGGFRTLITYQRATRSVFLYGFAKNERDNVSPPKLAELRLLARRFASLSDAEIDRLLQITELREIDYAYWKEKDRD